MTLNFLLASAAGGFNLHYQLIVGSTVLVVGFLILLGFLAYPQIGVVPRGWGAAFEHVFDWLDGMAHDMIGPEGRQYVPFLMSLFLFVLVSNWSGLLPWPVFSYTPPDQAVVAHHDDHDEAHAEDEHGGDHHGHHIAFEAPSASYNTTLALAVISFLAFNYYGLKKRLFPGLVSHHQDGDDHHHSPGGLAGLWEWISHFWQPVPMLWQTMEGSMKLICIPLFFLFLGLNIVEELARILSLSIRLFGNISGEHQVKVNLLATLQSFLGSMVSSLKVGSLGFIGWGTLGGLIWVASAFATCLGALAGFIQAMIFAVLSLVYIAHAVADDH